MDLDASLTSEDVNPKPLTRTPTPIFRYLMIEVFPTKGLRIVGPDRDSRNLRLIGAFAGGTATNLKLVDNRGWFCYSFFTVARAVNIAASFGWSFVTSYSSKSYHPFSSGEYIAVDCFVFRKLSNRMYIPSASETFVDAVTVPEVVYAPSTRTKSVFGKKNKANKRKSFRKQPSDANANAFDEEWGVPPAAEPVFGVSIKSLALTHFGVPSILVEMIDFINRDEFLKTEGIFRISASTAVIADVKRSIDNGTRLGFSDLNDVHVVANLLKIFLKSLPESLLPADIIDMLDAVPEMTDEQSRVAAVSWMVQNYVPEPNFSSLKYIAGFLSNVIKCSAHNRMTVQNLALVLGPNLLFTPNDPLGGAALASMRGLSCLIDVMIYHQDAVFTPSEDPNTHAIAGDYDAIKQSWDNDIDDDDEEANNELAMFEGIQRKVFDSRSMQMPPRSQSFRTRDTTKPAPTTRPRVMTIDQIDSSLTNSYASTYDRASSPTSLRNEGSSPPPSSLNSSRVASPTSPRLTRATSPTQMESLPKPRAASVEDIKAITIDRTPTEDKPDIGSYDIN